MSNKVTIYGLRDPESKKIFYIGRSARVQTRFTQHLNEAKKYKASNETMLERLFGIKEESVTIKKEEKDNGNSRKLNWINQIIERGQEVELVILDEWDNCTTDQDANRLEDAWIAHMRSKNQPLTNFFYSTRMEIWWYGESNKNFKEGWAKSPAEYIEMLKAGKVGSQTEGDTDRKRKYSRSQKRRLAKKNYRKTSKKAGRKPKAKSRRRKK